jgi:hypothetical protein
MKAIRFNLLAECTVGFYERNLNDPTSNRQKKKKKEAYDDNDISFMRTSHVLHEVVTDAHISV